MSTGARPRLTAMAGRHCLQVARQEAAKAARTSDTAMGFSSDTNRPANVKVGFKGEPARASRVAKPGGGASKAPSARERAGGWRWVGVRGVAALPLHTRPGRASCADSVPCPALPCRVLRHRPRAWHPHGRLPGSVRQGHSQPEGARCVVGRTHRSEGAACGCRAPHSASRVVRPCWLHACGPQAPRPATPPCPADCPPPPPPPCLQAMNAITSEDPESYRYNAPITNMMYAEAFADPGECGAEAQRHAS